MCAHLLIYCRPAIAVTLTAVYDVGTLQSGLVVPSELVGRVYCTVVVPGCGDQLLLWTYSDVTYTVVILHSIVESRMHITTAFDSV